MNIDFHLPDSEGASFLLVWLVAWILTLGLILRRRDLDSVTKLTWVVTVIFVPVFGILLYFFLAPGEQWIPEAKKTNDDHDPLRGTPWKNNAGFTSKATSSET